MRHRETKGFIQDYSVDDLHAAALAEFENDPRAVQALNRAYVEAQSEYIFTLMQLRAEKANAQ